jgi:hypothetical protein
MLATEFLDIINLAICEAAHDYFGDRARQFFRKVGEYHLKEALRRGAIQIDSSDKPLDALLKIAKYLESVGYMKRIVIDRLSETEALVQMHGVSVTNSSLKILEEGKEPSHYMTNVMLAALEKLGVQAELKDVDFDRQRNQFKESWRILGLAR